MRLVWALVAGATLAVSAGCRPVDYRQDADRTALRIVENAQVDVFGEAEPFTIEQPSETLRRKLLLEQDLPVSGPQSLGSDYLERPKSWPEKDYPRRYAEWDKPPWLERDVLVLTVDDALGIAARNNRDYQSRKEDVFRAALSLDLEANQFRNLLFGSAESVYTADHGRDPTLRGIETGGTLAWQRRLMNGTLLTSRFMIDLAQLLTGDRSSSLGLFADATISIPLLRGSGREIVTEPLTQAERDVVYALYNFERYKQTLAVRVASEALAVLQQQDQVRNAEENYRRLIDSTRRAQRLADAGRLPQIQVDQAKQDELRARDRWITAQQAYERRLDAFKIVLGLPTDALVELDRGELDRLAERSRQVLGEPGVDQSPVDAVSEAADLVMPGREGGGPLEMDPQQAVEIALANRLDMLTSMGRVYDAQRRVIVAADALRAELTLLGSGRAGSRRALGSAGLPNAQLRPEQGLYAFGVSLDLPLERTSERNVYRNSYILLERSVRDAQDLEDQIKLQIRDGLRSLLQARESYRIQAQAVELAQRRVASTELFLQAGRAQIRDVLDAEESLVSAQNALTAALVNYRITELELQRDMDVLDVDSQGRWREYIPSVELEYVR